MINDLILKPTEFLINDNIAKIIITQKKNNFIVTITDLKGNVLFSESPGTIGYRKSRRKSFYTYQEVIKVLFYKIKKKTKLNTFYLVYKGICKGKRAILITLLNLNIKIISITSEVIFAKNGCRTKKQRRL